MKAKAKTEARDLINDKAAMGIARLIAGMQARFGSGLNRRTQDLSRKGKLILLLVFCICFGGASLYIMIEGLHSPASSFELSKSKFITIPKHIDRTGDPSPRIKAFITPGDIKKIESFRRYMDSLQTTRQGLLIHDSIIRARPGLMDSLIEVERLYGIDSAAKAR
jgi:hypothetical protein